MQHKNEGQIDRKENLSKGPSKHLMSCWTELAHP